MTDKPIYVYEPILPITSTRFITGHSWEMDAAGWHRIVSPNGTVGDWAPYTVPALSADGAYLCVSEYYGCLPEQRDPAAPPDILAETLYQITPIPRA